MVTAIVLGLTVLAFALLVLQRRWISDDGLIFLRTVRQILAGNGPVFNVGERVEANTSTLWTVVLLGLALVPAAGFPRSELDARLRALLLDVLRAAAWLPGAMGGTAR